MADLTVIEHGRIISPFCCSAHEIQTALDAPQTRLYSRFTLHSQHIHSHPHLSKPVTQTSHHFWLIPWPQASVPFPLPVMPFPTPPTWQVRTPLLRACSVAFHATRRVGCFLFSVCESTSIFLDNGTSHIVIIFNVHVYLSCNSSFIPNVVYSNCHSINVCWDGFNPSIYGPGLRKDGIRLSVSLLNSGPKDNLYILLPITVVSLIQQQQLKLLFFPP